MAGKSLGTLTIDLIAEVGGFVRGMDKAERASEQWRKKITNDAALVGTAIGAAVSAVAAGTISFIKSTSEHVTETDRWAKSLGISTSALMQWQYAAEKAGLSSDNISDIFKDLNDKIGDAVLNKSGEAAQALDTLGLSAKKLQDLSPDKALLAIAKAMDGMNIAQKTNIYESLGNDLTKLMPLLNDGAEGLNKLRQASVEKGIAPSDDEIAKLTAVNKIFQDWEDSFEGFRNRFAVGLAGIDLSSLTNSFQSIENTLTSPEVLQGLANMISGLGKVVNLLAGAAKYANDIAYGWGKTGETNQASSLDALIAKRKELNESLAYSESWYGKIDTWTGQTRSVDEVRKSIAQNEALINSFQARQQAKGIVALTSPDPKAGIENLRLGKGEHNQKVSAPKPKIDHAALKLDNSFASTEQAYLKQIALIDTTGKKSAVVTEQQKLAFDLSTGKLAGLNALQQKRLQSLAAEVDHLNAVKKANEDNAKALEYVNSLHKENDAKRQGLDADFIGAYSSSDQRDRLRQLASIRQDFAGRQTDLQSQYDSGDIDKDLYDQKTKALSDSLEEQLKIQTDYYKNVDALRNNGTAGFMSGLSDQINASADLYSNMQQVGAQTFSNLTDMITQWAETGKLNVKDFAATFLQSMGSALLQYAAAQVAMAALSAFTSWIGVPYVGPAVAPAQATAAAAGAGVFMTAIGSSLHGMAHDGIDSVPETGTWLLQKGERVTTAQTSAKLDATLERVASQSTGGNSYSPTIHIPINGNPSDATIQLVQKAAQQGARDGYNMVTRDLSSGEGKVHKALTGNYKTGRKIG